jgi:hypothetical protein
VVGHGFRYDGLDRRDRERAAVTSLNGDLGVGAGFREGWSTSSGSARPLLARPLPFDLSWRQGVNVKPRNVAV